MKFFVYIEIEEHDREYHVYFIVEESDEASGKKVKVGTIRQFIKGTWKLWPEACEENEWNLHHEALVEITNKVKELNDAN